MTDRPKGVRDVKSAARTVDVLEVVSGLKGRPTSVLQLAERMDLPRSGLYALSQTLVNRGRVRTDTTGTRYAIGVRALLVGTSDLDGDQRLAAARPQLDALAEQLGETVHFARLDGADVVYLATRESRHYLRPFSRVGPRLPASVTSLGKALRYETPVQDAISCSAPAARLTPGTEHAIVEALGHTRAALERAALGPPVTWRRNPRSEHV